MCLHVGTNFYRNRLINDRDTAFVGLQDGDGGGLVTQFKYFRFRFFLVRHVLYSLSTNFHQNRLINGRDCAFVDFQDGGGSSTSGFGFFEFGMCFSVWVQSFIKIGS